MSDSDDLNDFHIPTLTDIIGDDTDIIGDDTGDKTEETVVTIGGLTAEQALSKHQKEFEVLIEDIAEDVKDELNMHMEGIVRKAINSALNEILEQSSKLMQKSMMQQLTSSLPPILDLVAEDMKSIEK